MKRTWKLFRNQLLIIIYVIAIFTILSFGYKDEKVTTIDVGNMASLQTYHLVSKYNPTIVETLKASSFTEALKVAETNPVIYQGTMTAYGPDCVGCSGIVACAPYPNVSKTIYYNDNVHGKVRIVAADRRIPCGTIVKVRNSSIATEFTAIVLDRGGAIKNSLMDLLYDKEVNTNSFGRQKVEYEIIRWGW